MQVAEWQLVEIQVAKGGLISAGIRETKHMQFGIFCAKIHNKVNILIFPNLILKLSFQLITPQSVEKFKS